MRLDPFGEFLARLRDGLRVSLSTDQQHVALHLGVCDAFGRDA
jgi:hypothetical protein